ncbi:hypothetical protein EDB83DRAFT_2269042 [Lactarius deliciosus]|nr:hypothetical protein EDB83DRAFT_2269042 [Lactarius deliciosus]
MAYCDRCERSFPHDRAYEQHSAHWLCDSCDIDFASEECLIQHYGNSPKNRYCKECDRDFDSTMSKMQHVEAKHWYCETHDRIFNSEYSRESHYRQSDDHIYCVECEMNFDDDDEWWVHLAEEPPRCTRRAAASAGCGRTFVSPSAPAEHFGSGTCASWTGLSCARTARTA